ncbi:MAG: cytidine deaminase [Planctomycetota bacterium]
MDPGDQQLIDAALQAQKNAYAPYSKFSVGAALRTANGEVFSGVNVENASYGLTICAERSAAVAAVSAGARQIEVVAIVSKGGASPCGACRQFLAEFGGGMRVLLVDSDQPNAVRETTLDVLLPDQFSFKPTE